jgi:hypothetical protein
MSAGWSADSAVSGQCDHEARLMSDEMATAVWFLATEPARARRILDRHCPDDDGRCRSCRHASNPCLECQVSGWALRALDIAES